MPAPRFRVITLDLDDTLWPCAPVIRAAEDALYAWLTVHAPRLAAAHDVASMREHRKRLMDASPEIAHDLGLIRQRSLAALLADFGYPVALADRALALFLEHRNRVRPYADVLPALVELASRYQLISVTNGNADVGATPLRGLFAHSVNAVDAGAAKPDPAVFLHALRLVDCTPERCLHLGDDPWRDVEAARSCGLAAVWINRGGKDWPETLRPPVLSASDLSQVVTWLDGGIEGALDGL